MGRAGEKPGHPGRPADRPEVADLAGVPEPACSDAWPRSSRPNTRRIWPRTSPMRRPPRNRWAEAGDNIPWEKVKAEAAHGESRPGSQALAAAAFLGWIIAESLQTFSTAPIPALPITIRPRVMAI